MLVRGMHGHVDLQGLLRLLLERTGRGAERLEGGEGMDQQLVLEDHQMLWIGGLR